MADLKKLAKGRKAFAKLAEAGTADKPKQTLEQSCAEEIGEAEEAFRGRMKKEDKRRKAAVDSEFWFAVYFDSREAKEKFLFDHGLSRIGDKYLDGCMVDRVLKVRAASIRNNNFRGR